MAAKRLRDRKDVATGDKWDLAPLFEDDDQWEQSFKNAESGIDRYDSFRGRLGESIDRLVAAIAFHLESNRKIEKLYTYAHLKSDEDKANQHYLGMYQRAVNLHTRASEAASFLTPEIQQIPEQAMKAYRSAPECETYRFYLEKIVRYKPHTLGESEEQILAMSRDATASASQIFSQLDNVDLSFGSLSNEAGERIELTHGNFLTFLISPDRKMRQTVFAQYYRSYEDHQNTIAAALAGSIKKDLFYSRARNFKSCRAGALFGDNVPEAVYDNLIQTVRANLAPLFDYLRFRQKKLGLKNLHFYDTYVPLVSDIRFEMPFEQAVDICAAAVEPLGEAYAEILRDGLLGGWVDRYENRGKRSGAYSSGCYDSPPYILLNYDRHNINSLYTLMHEAGHSMHSYYARKHQAYVDHDYTIFVAEVASTFNEDLLSRHLLQKYSDDPLMSAYILNREIDNIRATLFRQTMFAEFEKLTHALVEDNQPLTLEVFREIYRSLLEVYFGDAMVIDPQLELECLRIPHFYSGFYVYKYATGISAAMSLAEKVAREGDPARQAYLAFLKMGGSRFPLEELSTAGVDLHSPAPIQQAINRFDRLVKKLSSAPLETGSEPTGPKNH
jgi:oligoendopeptidase F